MKTIVVDEQTPMTPGMWKALVAYAKKQTRKTGTTQILLVSPENSFLCTFIRQENDKVSGLGITGVSMDEQ